MKERLSWEEIVNRYPETWVRLEDIEHAPNNDATVLTAIVTKIGNPTDQDIFDAMDGICEEKYTYGGNILRVGGVTR